MNELTMNSFPLLQSPSINLCSSRFVIPENLPETRHLKCFDSGLLVCRNGPALTATRTRTATMWLAYWPTMYILVHVREPSYVVFLLQVSCCDFSTILLQFIVPWL